MNCVIDGIEDWYQQDPNCLIYSNLQLHSIYLTEELSAFINKQIVVSSTNICEE